jgi:hypothetical protein
MSEGHNDFNQIGLVLACTGYILWYCGKFRLADSALGLSFLTVIVIFARGEGVLERGDTGIYSAYYCCLINYGWGHIAQSV